MALTDPQSITIGASTISLPRINSGSNSSTYSSNDGNVQLVVSNAYGRRCRRVARVDHRKVAVDPLTSNNVEVSTSVYVVFDAPKTGYTTAELKDIYAGLNSLLSASTYAVTTKILGGEN